MKTITILLLTQYFFAMRFNVQQKNDLCSSAELKEPVDNSLFIQLNQEKFNIIIDYQKFNNQCHKVNMLLTKHGYLRVFELKKNPPSSVKKSKKTKHCQTIIQLYKRKI